MDRSALHNLIDTLAGGRVACLGDVMLDRFTYGAVSRVSPEAPIPVLRIDREAEMLGGAGNVARNLAALGVETVLIAAVGDDAAGRAVAELAASEANIAARLIVEAGRPTTLKTRYVADGQQLLRADAETTAAPSAATVAALLAALDAALETADVLVLSDYAKGVLCDAVLAAAIRKATAAGVPVVADPKRRDIAAYAGVTLLKPNVAELAAAAGLACDDDAGVAAAAAALLAGEDIAAMLVSRSGAGVSLVTAEGVATHLPADAREVFDVSGAGDTVVATAAAALAAGADLEQAARLANLAGGVVVGKVGTAVVHADDLAAALASAEATAQDAKIVTATGAAERVARWRARGLSVGFTNGCFDILHPGHVSLLRQARAACDRLIVGLNSDVSVARLKGPDRPVQTETARARVLASLEAADLVVVFADDTPLALLQTLKPDLLVKGADYTLDQVVGAREVRAWGGRVLLADIVDGHSTTGTIARMNRATGGGG